MDMNSIPVRARVLTMPRPLHSACRRLRAGFAALREIAAIEPAGDGDVLANEPAFRRKLADMEIALLALETTVARTTALETLLALRAEELGRHLAALTLEAIGPYAAVATGERGHNARIGAAHAAGALDDYMASHASVDRPRRADVDSASRTRKGTAVRWT